MCTPRTCKDISITSTILKVYFYSSCNKNLKPSVKTGLLYKSLTFRKMLLVSHNKLLNFKKNIRTSVPPNINPWTQELWQLEKHVQNLLKVNEVIWYKQ